MSLTDLITAVAGSVRDCGGIPTKTKILKLLYLLDIEAYRKTRVTLTGFDWKFYKYGPWTAAYDDALQEAAQASKIVLNAPNDDEGATFINVTEKLPLAEVFPDIVQRLTAKKIIEAWASRPTVELLDYVYFHTAPMRDARRNEPLDFSTVEKEEPLLHYTGIKSKTDERETQRKRTELFKRLSSVRKSRIQPLDPPARYDEAYWAAVDKLEREAD
jgi:hypothetical protein